MTALDLLKTFLGSRLDAHGAAWFAAEAEALAAGPDSLRLGTALSKASRVAKDSTPLAPNDAERAALDTVCPGLEAERWTLLETLRVALVLSLGGLDGDGGARAVEEAFRYADEGEARALYRSLALLPGPARFAWRGGEGCRSNMVSVFEAVALDTPFPRAWFDDVAWKQAVVKCLFVGAPLWRMVGLDERLDTDLARMVLDLVEERTSAGREVYPELWACLGRHGGERGLAALERAATDVATPARSRAAAAVGLARAGATAQLEHVLAAGPDPLVAEWGRRALAGETSSRVWRAFRDDA